MAILPSHLYIQQFILTESSEGGIGWMNTRDDYFCQLFFVPKTAEFGGVTVLGFFFLVTDKLLAPVCVVLRECLMCNE